jgi:hypothetical protein
VSAHQFSVSRQQRVIGMGGDGLPGIFVQYDFSPLMVKYMEVQMQVYSFVNVTFIHIFRPLTAFLVSLCAIVGGVFTVAGIVDAFIYNSQRILRQKLEIGKGH